MAPDFAKYNPNCYGPNAGALPQIAPSPFIGSCDWTRASTPHTAIQVLLADGSGRSIAGNISAATWWYAFTPSGGETMPSDWQ
jgi:hypothetical protein